MFCAVRTTNVPSAIAVINFDELFANEGAGFDIAADTFTPPASGLYWLHFSVGLPDVATTDVSLVGLTTAGRTPSIRRGYASDMIDTTSRNELVALTAGVDKLTLSTTGKILSDSLGLYISWSGFHLDSTMTTVVAFSVGLSVTIWETGAIRFDMLHVDTHRAWDAGLYQYVVPVGGTRVIALHCGDYLIYENNGQTRLHTRNNSKFQMEHSWGKDRVDIHGLTGCSVAESQRHGVGHVGRKTHQQRLQLPDVVDGLSLLARQSACRDLVRGRRS